jgi:IS30 family transposase
MAARRCRICEDSQRTEIDARLLLGTPLRTVAKEFSLKRSTLGRHLQRHVKQAGEAALARATASYSRHLRQHMEKIQEQTLQIVTAAKAKGDLQLALQAVREARQNSDVMRKLLTRADPNGKTKQATETPEIQIQYEEARPRVV